MQGGIFSWNHRLIPKLAAIIWYLVNLQGRQVLHLPHTIEFLNKPYADIFTISPSPVPRNYLSLYDARQGGAQDQL